MNQEIRKQFPLTDEWVYLNAAGASPQPLVVDAAARRFLDHHNLHAPDDMGFFMDRQEEVRLMVADLIHAQPSEVAFTMCTGDGPNIVANALDLGPGDNVVMDDLDYPTNFLVWWDYERRKGVEVRIVKNEGGAVPTSRFAEAVDEHTRVIAVSHASHANGFLQDLKSLADLAHAHNAYLLVDAIQTIGSIQVDVKALDVDFLTCASYKWLLGPRGLAFFYVKEALLDRIRPDRRGWMQIEKGFYDLPNRIMYTDAHKFEYGMLNYLGFFQLGAALEFINEIGMVNIEKQVLSLSSKLYRELSERGLNIFTPPGNKSGVVSFFARNGVEIGDNLEAKKIFVTGRPGYVRVAPHFFNLEKEIDVLADALSGMNIQK